MIGETPKELQGYYGSLIEKINHAKKIAVEARKRISSPTPYIEVMFARDLAERVELLVGPKGIAEKIRKLFSKTTIEKLALRLAEDIILEHGTGGDDEKIILQAIRTSLAVMTPPCITAAPTEGIVKVKIKKNLDGTRYLAVYFAGPIRSAGGTELAAVVVLADYVRRLMGLDKYIPTYEEIVRFIEELRVYKKMVSRFQYNVPDNIIEYVLKNLPVEVTGIPTDRILVSSFRNLPRIETNYLRGGALRVVNDGIAGRAKKVLKLVEKVGLDGWDWIKEVIKMMEQVKNEDERYFDEVVGGRPILSLPDRFGGLRIRYGRAPSTGLASIGLHPLTLEVLNWYIVSGTQLKLDYPGKGGVVAVVDTIEPPHVLTEDGELLRLDDHSKYMRIKEKIAKILFLGDILISVGDLIENNVILYPPGFCEEWWAEELRMALVNSLDKVDRKLLERIDSLITDPFHEIPSVDEAIIISFRTGAPLHPRYTAFWTNITVEESEMIRRWIRNGIRPLIHKDEEIHLPRSDDIRELLIRILVEHRVESDRIVIPKSWFKALIATLQPFREERLVDGPILEHLSRLSGLKIKDKTGTFISARMGRPEKAAQRETTPPVNILFPIGLSGGPSRDIVQASNNNERVAVELVRRICPNCRMKTWKHRCPKCGIITDIIGLCESCGSEKKYDGESTCVKCGGTVHYFEKFVVNVAEEVYEALRRIGEAPPSKIKGVKRLTSLTRTPEELSKGIMRAKHGLFIYKDGTMRFDVTNAPLTHFTPRQIGTKVEKLRELGYTHDIYGNLLTSPDQYLELRIQDIIIPREAAEHLFKVSKVIDDELVKLAGMNPYYNFNSPEDVIGELVVVLSPHTYAASVSRVIGIVDALVCFAHPVLHAAKRRDCDGDEDSIMLLLDPLINFSKLYLPDRIGGRMDTPLLITSIVYPEEVDEQAHNLDVADRYPLEFYRRAEDREHISKVSGIILTVKNFLGEAGSYTSTRFTHPQTSLTTPVKESAYKKHSSMLDKIVGQLDIANKLAGIDVTLVVEKIMQTHILPDIVGNARAFFTQEFRCKRCGLKYRRLPITTKCSRCGGELMQTVFRGAVEKYVELARKLLSRYVKTPYLKEYGYMSIENIERMLSRQRMVGGKVGRQASLESFSS
ncbi:MAG: DNA polymerase II large subunit [Candidatus Caldarchaeales archaeon]